MHAEKGNMMRATMLRRSWVSAGAVAVLALPSATVATPAPSVVSSTGTAAFTRVPGALVGVWADPSRLRVARMDDGAARWRDVGGTATPGFGSTTDLRAVANGRGDIAVLWVRDDPVQKLGHVHAAVFRRGGGTMVTWLADAAHAGNPLIPMTRVSDIVAEDDGTITIAWQTGDGTVRARSLPPGGTAWSQVVDVAGPSRRPDIGGQVAIAAQPGGGSLLVWSVGPPPRETLGWAERTHTGWRPVASATADAPGQFPASVRRSDGALVVVSGMASGTTVAVSRRPGRWSVRSAGLARGKPVAGGTRTALFSTFAGRVVWMRDRDTAPFRRSALPLTASAVAAAEDGALYAAGPLPGGGFAWTRLPVGSSTWSAPRVLPPLGDPATNLLEALVPRPRGGMDLVVGATGQSPRPTVLTPTTGTRFGRVRPARPRLEGTVHTQARVEVVVDFTRFSGPSRVDAEALVAGRWRRVGGATVASGGRLPVRFPRPGATLLRLRNAAGVSPTLRVRVEPTALREIPVGGMPMIIHRQGNRLWVLSYPQVVPNPAASVLDPVRYVIEARLLDVRTGRMRTRPRMLPTALSPSRVVVADGRLWLATETAQRYRELDVATGGLGRLAVPTQVEVAGCGQLRAVRVPGRAPYPVQSDPLAVPGRDGTVWTASISFTGAYDDDSVADATLQRCRPGTPGGENRGPIGPMLATRGEGEPAAMRAVESGVWVSNLSGAHFWAGPTGPVVPMGGYGAIAHDARGTWALRRDDDLSPVRLVLRDPVSGDERAVRTVPMSGDVTTHEPYGGPTGRFEGLAVGPRSAWVVNGQASTVVEVPLPRSLWQR